MEEKKKHKVMIGIEVILLGMIIAIIGTNAASSNPPSNGVSYSKNNQTTVEGALNDLYSKASYGNATAAQILKDKTALVGGKKVTGTYEAPTLASQTLGDATGFDIAPSKIAWVNGEKIVGYPLMTDKVKLGDYVTYASRKVSYIIPKSDTGYGSDQNINPSELNLWRVIKKNIDGTVELVSEYVSEVAVSLKGSLGYQKMIGTLNKIAISYEKDGYTVGSRHMGYDGIAVENCTSNSSCNSDEGYKIDMNLVETIVGSLQAKKKINEKVDGKIVEVASDAEYFLASRSTKFSNGVGVNGNVDNNNYLKGRYIDKYGNDSSQSIYIYSRLPMNESVSEVNFKKSIRPIVVLSSMIRVSGGNGTENSPWIIGI